MGAVTVHGGGVAALWDGVRAARSHGVAGVGTHGPTGVVAPITDIDPGTVLKRKLLSQTDRSTQWALLAADEALRDAALLDDGGGIRGVPAQHCAVVMGIGVGPVGAIAAEHERVATGRRVRPFLSVTVPSNMAAGQIARRHGLRGPCFVVASACAAGTDAIGMARDLVLAGRADIVVAGGCEAPLTPMLVDAFGAAGALSGRCDDPTVASRPFDIDRDGFVLGEGAGVVIVESMESARRRDATTAATVAGWASTNDAYHPTRPAPDGAGAIAAVDGALADAELDAAAIDHVNAHATSTRINDRVEAQVLRTVLGDRVSAVPVTATKSTTGHLFGAAGAVEAVATICALRERLVPPIANLDAIDPDCADLDLVRGQPRPLAGTVALSTSLGFGGHNAALLLSAPTDRDA